MDKTMARVEAEVEMAAIRLRIERYHRVLDEEYGKLSMYAVGNKYTQAENTVLRALLKDAIEAIVGAHDLNIEQNESLKERYETFLQDYGGDD